MIITTYLCKKRNHIIACKVFKVCFGLHQKAHFGPCSVPTDRVPIGLCIHHRSRPSTYLHGSGSSRGAGSDLEQPRFCGCCLPSFPRCSTLVNNQGLSTKHTHQMRWLFSLHYSFLEKKKLAVSFRLLHKIYQKRPLQPSFQLEYSYSTQLITRAQLFHPAQN